MLETEGYKRKMVEWAGKEEVSWDKGKGGVWEKKRMGLQEAFDGERDDEL